MKEIIEKIEKLDAGQKQEFLAYLRRQELLGKWGLVLGGSGGFGKAAVEILAAYGMNMFVVYREDEHRHEHTLIPEFKTLAEKCQVTIETMNTDVFKEEDGIFEQLQDVIGEGNLTFFMHSIAAGSCRAAVESLRPEYGELALKSLAETLTEKGISVDSNLLQEAVNQTFREKSAPALHLLAKTERELPKKFLSAKDIRSTIERMGTSFGHWIVKLYNQEMFASFARCVGLTSEGSFRAIPGYNAVGAAKAVLEHSCMVLAQDLGRAGISISVLEAGITDTQALSGIPHNDLMYAQAKLRTATGEVTTPESVVQILPFLCKEESRHITGSAIKVNGAEHVL